MADEIKTPQIYEAIIGVMSDIGVVGKNSKNDQQGFMYRGIDAVMSALNPAMVKNKVFMLPTVLNEDKEIRTTRNGSALYVVRLKMSYKFYTTDGSYVESIVIGEASDSGDKAYNKAMSVAYKYAAFQVFSIPTDELRDMDPDKTCLEETMVQQPAKIDSVMLNSLKNKMSKKGVTEDIILKTKGFENCKSIEDFTIELYASAMKKLDLAPDVEPKEQLDLGL